MSAGLMFLIGGLAAIAISYMSRSLFVNRGDEENPYRRLSTALGVAGLISAVWGVVLLVF